MFKRAIGLVGLVVSVSVMACSGAPESGDENVTGDDALTSAAAASEVKGAWTLQNDVTSVTAIVVNSDHTFFRANTPVLNGMFLPGHEPGAVRETGTWSISAAKGTMTFKTAQGEEAYTFTFTKAVLNGMFLPGHEPKDRLELRGIPAKGSQIAFPTQEYVRADSYCFDKSDCNAEMANKIWTPVEAENVERAQVYCNAKTNACELSVSFPQQ
jgi:hypothetical protein